MSPEDKLDELLNRTSTMQSQLAVQGVHLEYLSRADVETDQRLTALERWRFTIAGGLLLVAFAAPQLWSLIGSR